MKVRSKICLENCQIKSGEKFKAVAHAIDVIEKETFVGSGIIYLSNVFVCPDINLKKFYDEGKPTERLLAIILIRLHVEHYGKNSHEDYLSIANNERQLKNRPKVRVKR